MPVSFVITELDPFDATSFDAWHAAYAEASRFGREATAAIWTREEMRVQMQDRDERAWRTGYVGRLGDRVVTTGVVSGSNRHNLDLAEVAVTTVPGERGRGYGSAMLAQVEATARERDRSILATEIPWTLAADPNGVGAPDVEFAVARGFRVGLVDIQRQLRLPVAEALLDELAAEAASHHAAYILRSFAGPVPDDLVHGWAELEASLPTEAPIGDLEREPEQADVEAVRAAEAVLAKQGRTKFNTAALAPDGAVVAYTDIAVTVHEPDRAYQWGTLVRGDHRGHRLGLAVKVANLRLLQAEAPQIRTLVTYNAEVNAHMIGVNERLGFRPVERLGELQKKLAGPPA